MKVLVVVIGIFAAGGIGVLVWQHNQHAETLRSQLQLSHQENAELSVENIELLKLLEQLRAEQAEQAAQLHAMAAGADASIAAGVDAAASGVALQQQYQQLSAAQTELLTRLDAVSAERDAAVRHAQRAELDRASMEHKMLRLREQLTFLRRDYQAVAEQFTAMQARLKSQTHSYAAVASSVAPAASPPPSATRSSAALSQPPAASWAAATVELPPIFVRQDAAGMRAPITGRIIQISDQHHFVVINRGRDGGVRPGMRFEVVRGTQHLGQMVARRVRSTLAACDVVEGNPAEPWQVGDVAVQRIGAPQGHVE